MTGEEHGLGMLSQKVLVSALMCGLAGKAMVWQRALCLSQLPARVAFTTAVVFWSLRCGAAPHTHSRPLTTCTSAQLHGNPICASLARVTLEKQQ